MTKTIETNIEKNDEYDICKDCVSHKEVYVYSELFVYHGGNISEQYVLKT